MNARSNPTWLFAERGGDKQEEMTTNPPRPPRSLMMKPAPGDNEEEREEADLDARGEVQRDASEEEDDDDADEAGFSESGFEYDEDDGYPTSTSIAQRDTEHLVEQTLLLHVPEAVEQFRTRTADYLRGGLHNVLDQRFVTLESSRPWIIYWITHALRLMRRETEEEVLSESECASVVRTLRLCWNPVEGGYGGNFHQLSHTAPTYASVMALMCVGTREAYDSIPRGPLYRYLLSLKDPATNSFRVHADGECDTRGVYTVLAVAAILNMLTPELTRGVADWIRLCQGFDGGLGGEPFNESHGGYAYCGLASCVLLGNADKILDLKAFSRWLVNRQMKKEGGFQGRTNKLVDSCYSFWQGASFGLLARCAEEVKARAGGGEAAAAVLFTPPPCNVEALRRYVLGACAYEGGGFRDKPSVSRDYYHTCYALSGLSVTSTEKDGIPLTDCVFNLEVSLLARAKSHFAALPSSHAELVALQQ